LELLSNPETSSAMASLLDSELAGNNSNIISFIKNNPTNTSILNYCCTGNQERSQNIWDKVMTDLNTNPAMTTLAIKMLAANTSIMSNVLDGEFSASGATDKIKAFILNNCEDASIKGYVTSNNADGSRVSNICSNIIFPNMDNESAKSLLTTMLSHAQKTTDNTWARALDNELLSEIGMNTGLDNYVMDNVTSPPVLSFLLSNLSDEGFQSFLVDSLCTQMTNGGKFLELMDAFIKTGTSLSGYDFDLREGVTTSDWKNGLLNILGQVYVKSFNDSGLTVVPKQYDKDEYKNIRDTINNGKTDPKDTEDAARSNLLIFIDWKTSSTNSMKNLLEQMIINNTPK